MPIKERPYKISESERWLIGLERCPELSSLYTKFIVQYNCSEELAMRLTKSLKVARLADEATRYYIENKLP
jgi:hypothetical protein